MFDSLALAKIEERLEKIELALLRIAEAIEHQIPPILEYDLDPETSVVIDEPDTTPEEEEPIPEVVAKEFGEPW